MRTIVLFGALVAYLVWKLAGNPDFFSGQAAVGYQIGGHQASGSILSLTLVVGEIFVFLFYWFKFNEWAGDSAAPPGFRPRPVRHFTTWLRFLGWNSAYGLIMVAAYTTIVFFPDLIARIVSSFAKASVDMQASVAGLAETKSLIDLFFGGAGHQIYKPSNPAELAPYAVVLVTVIWAGMRPFSDFERRFRLQLQERAAVPTQARNLIETFRSRKNRFCAEKKVIQEAIEQSNNTLCPEDFDNCQNSLNCWLLYARVEYLYGQLQRYWHKPVFANLSVRYAEEFQDLETRIECLRERINERLNEILGVLKDEGLADADKTPLTLRQSETWLQKLDAHKKSSLRSKHFGAQLKEIDAEIKGTWQDILQLIVCSILAVGRTPAHRQELFEAFGLSLGGHIPLQLNWETITWMTLVTMGTVFASSITYYMLLPELSGDVPPHVPSDLNEVVWWSVVASCMHLVALLAGYTVQRSLDTHRERLQIGKARLPSRSDLIAEASWAAIFGVSLNVLLIGLLLASDGKFGDLQTNWWWALVPGVTAFFAAAYTQQEHRKRLQQKITDSFAPGYDKRLLLTQAAATGLTAYLVVLLLYHQDYSLLQPKMLLYGTYVAITSALLGLALGLILREWVRATTKAVILEKKGEREKRSNRKHYRAAADWIEKDRKLPVQTFSISDNGAELVSKETLVVGSKGQISIPPYEPVLAKVLRQDENDERHYYIRYIRDAA